MEEYEPYDAFVEGPSEADWQYQTALAEQDAIPAAIVAPDGEVVAPPSDPGIRRHRVKETKYILQERVRYCSGFTATAASQNVPLPNTLFPAGAVCFIKEAAVVDASGSVAMRGYVTDPTLTLLYFALIPDSGQTVATYSIGETIIYGGEQAMIVLTNLTIGNAYLIEFVFDICHKVVCESELIVVD